MPLSPPWFVIPPMPSCKVIDFGAGSVVCSRLTAFRQGGFTTYIQGGTTSRILSLPVNMFKDTLRERLVSFRIRMHSVVKPFRMVLGKLIEVDALGSGLSRII